MKKRRLEWEREENDEKLNHKISQSIMQEANELRRDDLNTVKVDGGGKSAIFQYFMNII
jgi:hypothetical protein